MNLSESHVCSLTLLMSMLLSSVASAGTAVCFEAEDATSVEAPMKRVTSPPLPQDEACLETASGNAYLEIPQGAGKPPEMTTGKAGWVFSVPKDGTYYLWARVWWDDGCGNSVGISIDGDKPFTFGQDATYRCWHWVKSPPRLSQLKLEQGAHKLTIHNREDGVRIDQLLLTTSRRFVPVEIEPVTVTSTRQSD